ncbi:hypothetical protein G7046_g9122 [Stylonectria norvegica]|nr:hypothetical protein G7046_g9122 [Stylonectria norvegica]
MSDPSRGGGSFDVASDQATYGLNLACCKLACNHLAAENMADGGWAGLCAARRLRLLVMDHGILLINDNPTECLYLRRGEASMDVKPFSHPFDAASLINANPQTLLPLRNHSRQQTVDSRRRSKSEERQSQQSTDRPLLAARPGHRCRCSFAAESEVRADKNWREKGVEKRLCNQAATRDQPRPIARPRVARLFKQQARSSRGFIRASADNKIATKSNSSGGGSGSGVNNSNSNDYDDDDDNEGSNGKGNDKDGNTNNNPSLNPSHSQQSPGGNDLATDDSGRRFSKKRDFLQGLMDRARRRRGDDTAGTGGVTGGPGDINKNSNTGASRGARGVKEVKEDPEHAFSSSSSPAVTPHHQNRHNARAPPPSSASLTAASPRSPPDQNKPLPSPPPNQDQNPDAVATDNAIAPPAKPILKLAKIMATLTDNEIEKLFSGAPQFFARSEGHSTGAPNPSVAFPFDEELEIRDLTDHVQIEDKAWSAVTAWPHLTRDINHDAAAKKKAEEHQTAHFFIRLRERPNMLSMQGLEKGTMGFSAALELSVGDVLEEEQFGFESVGKKAKVVVETRERMLSATGSLRRLPETEILDRLKRNGELYRDNDLRKKTSIQTYQDLFHTFMRPCNAVVDKRDHYSLTNQINALLKCLGANNVWFDFTHVEWRIRLGQILWGEQDGDDLEDTSSIHDAVSANERAEEKYWLLMQILVATELLLRLDAITEGEEYGVESFRPIDVVHFERAATRMVKWSLHLARSWLENIDVAKFEGIPQKEPAPPQIPGWLGSLVSKITLHHHHTEATPPSAVYNYEIKGRHGQRQVNGLTHFAKKLQWPGIDTYSYETKISNNMQNSAAATPVSVATSKSTVSKRSSYFGQWDVRSGYSDKDKVQANRRKLAAALHAKGWLSKSYVFGLMLPGEGLYHYLMATLLENDVEAMEKLGPFANLCGGFVYGGKSFWSTSCIVGRVIAAGKGSAECMGWVSSDILPVGLSEGWVNIEVEDIAEDMAHLGKKARLWAKKRIEKESSILGDADDEQVLPADFIIPHENSYSTPPPMININLRSLELLAPANSIQTTPFTDPTPPSTSSGRKTPELLSYPANANFAISLDGQAPEAYSFSLSYDVNFVTAHPCAPPQRVRFLKSPTSPTIQQIDVFGSEMLGKSSRSAHRTGHPLHKFYNYTVIHISELLKKQHTPLSELLASPASSNPGYSPSRAGSNRVLVIDCITNFASVPGSPTLERLTSKYNIVQRRGSFPAAAQMHFESRKRQFGSDMEILVRALCAQKGWNAIISRRKRGCLACAIREAGALQWKVIVRVE